MSNKIENLMDQSSWSAGDLEDRDVVDQHMRSNNEGDYIEVDMQSSPEVVRQVASQQKDAARKKKKRLALIGVAVISVAATILAVGMAQRQQPPAAVAVPVQADLAGAGKPAQEVASQFASAPSAQPPQGAQPSEAAAQAQAGPAQQQPAAASAPANEAGSSSAPSPAGSVATVALPQQASTQASASVPVADVQSLRALQEENEALKRRIEELKMQARQGAAAAQPKPRVYGADVYRIYNDGIVLLDAEGRQHPVAIGEVTRRYGKLLATDPLNRTFTTDRGIIRPGG